MQYYGNTLQTLWIIFKSCIRCVYECVSGQTRLSACPSSSYSSRLHLISRWQEWSTSRKEGYIAPRGSLWLVLIQSKCGLGQQIVTNDDPDQVSLMSVALLLLLFNDFNVIEFTCVFQFTGTDQTEILHCANIHNLCN